MRANPSLFSPRHPEALDELEADALWYDEREPELGYGLFDEAIGFTGSDGAPNNRESTTYAEGCGWWRSCAPRTGPRPDRWCAAGRCGAGGGVDALYRPARCPRDLAAGTGSVERPGGMAECCASTRAVGSCGSVVHDPAAT
jgi:hypothetical protein